MQFRLKSKWFVLLALIVVMAMLAGCSSGEGKNKSSAEPSPTQQQKSEAPPTDDKGKDDNKPVEEKPFDFKNGTVRIGQWWGMENYLSDEEKEKQRKAEEKYNVKIEYVTVPFDEMLSKIITTAVAGQPFADIVMMPTQWVFPKLVNEGYIQPVDDFIDLNRPEWNNLMLNNGKANGKQYSFTDKDNNGHGFYYNKTLIQKNNLEDPHELQEKGLWTWDKFLEMAKAVTKDNVYGVHYFSQDLDLVLPLIYSNNGFVTKDNKILFDAPEAMEAIQFASDLYNVHKVVNREDGDAWHEGRVLFRPGYRWSAFDWNESMVDDWGYVFFPMGPKANNFVVPTTVNMWHLMAGVQNPEAVMAVWQELYELDQEKGYDAVIQGEEANFRNQESLDTLRKMLGNGTIIEYYAYDGFEEIFKEAIENIMTGKGTPASELARIKPMAQAAIDEVLK